MVKPPANSGNHPRFHAPVRHYHRAGSKGHVEWDEWVEGSMKSDKKGKISRKLLLSMMTVLVLAVAVTTWMALSAQ